MYTQYTISQNQKESHTTLSQICSYGIFSKRPKNEFETDVVNESSVLEPLKFYCVGHSYLKEKNGNFQKCLGIKHTVFRFEERQSNCRAPWDGVWNYKKFILIIRVFIKRQQEAKMPQTIFWLTQMLFWAFKCI